MSREGETVKSSIAVRVVGLRSGEGLVCGALYASSKGFPDDLESACGMSEIRAEKTASGEWEAELVFEECEAGMYAVSVIHDENENGKLDVGLFGIPKEGFGFSQNPKIRFGPPKFHAASFHHDGQTPSSTEVRAIYLSKP